MRRAILLLLLTTSVYAQKPWTSTFGAGLALTSGNTSTRNYNLSFTTKYDPKTRLLFKAEALYLLGSSNGEKQVDKATADAREEYTLSDRTFTFAELSYLRDPFKGISYSVAPLAGVGYRIFKSDRRTLSVDGAAGAIVENDLGIGRTTSGALKAGENFDWTISPSSKLTQKITGIWKTKDFADSLYHFDAGLATTIATRAELKLAYTYDYKNRPPSPEIRKGDSALFAAVLFKF
jgi:putative salt-induced outer membrane protein